MSVDYVSLRRRNESMFLSLPEVILLECIKRLLKQINRNSFFLKALKFKSHSLSLLPSEKRSVDISAANLTLSNRSIILLIQE